MSFSAADREENDRRVIRDIQSHGCHVVSVFDPEDSMPTFSYSIGMAESANAPDAIVIGLGPKLGLSLINRYCRKVMEGVQFRRGVKYEGFLDDFSVLFEPLRAERHAEYTLGCARHYKEQPYSVVQMIWPSTSGVWPWESKASTWLVANQPMLGRKRPDRR